MSLPANVALNLENLANSLRAQRLAHAYLVVGNPRGDAFQLVNRFVRRLLNQPEPDGPTEEFPTHPDLLCLEPKGKKRQIIVDDVRELMQRMNRTSFEGGWKVGVLLAADRLSQQAANASLKTLEEPPPRSCMFLLTDAPEHLLPTIHSRCQRIVLSSGQQLQDGSWRAPLMELLRQGVPKNALQAVQRGGLMETLLKQVEKEIATELEPQYGEEDETLMEARVAALLHESQSQLLRTMQLWFRDLLICATGGSREQLHFPKDETVLQQQATALNPAKALQNMDVMDRCIRRLEWKLPPGGVFESAWIELGRIAMS